MSWGEVKKINSDMGKPLDKLATEQSLEIKSDIRGVSNAVNAIASNDLIKQGVVKSLQRGMHRHDGADNNISISRVNIAKSLVVLSNLFGNSGQTVFAASLTSATNLRVTRTPSGGISGAVAWQVIEFF